MLTLPQVNSLIDKNGAMILDGGLATELENQGHNLKHHLWSARLLLTDPDAIRHAHRSYLEAGSMCITTASYQASIAGLAAEGLSESNAKRLLMDSVSIAKQAVADFVGQGCHAAGVDRPIVAGSIGPYGAYLADGSEYRGTYGISRSELKEFHEARLDAICGAEPDLLACETIPCKQEAEVLLDLLQKVPDALAWISFSCADGERINDGTPLKDCAAMLEEHDQVFAIGVNCTAPQYVSSLVKIIRDVAPGKRVVVYPNSGQLYNQVSKTWTGQSSTACFGDFSKEWRDAGATLIGGCCQTGPGHIRAIRESISV